MFPYTKIPFIKTFHLSFCKHFGNVRFSEHCKTSLKVLDELKVIKKIYE